MPRRTHELLNSNLALEPLLRSIQRRGTARNVFNYAHEVTKVNREWRIAERPVFMMMEELDSASRELKVLGRQLGFSYPSCPPEESIFGHRKKLNYLTYADKPAFPLPELVQVTKGCKDLSEHDRDQIQKNVQTNMQSLDQYRDLMGSNVVKLYDLSAKNFNSFDDKLTFHLELYGHCDAGMRELVKARLLSLFSPAVREALREHDRDRERDARRSHTPERVDSSNIYLNPLRSDFDREPGPSASFDSSSRGILGVRPAPGPP